MGLLLSVLVVCVGVAELLTFYWNFTRNLVTASTQTNLDDITRKYADTLQNLPIVESATLETTESIELEIPRNLDRSSTPKRFLLTEHKTNNRSSSPRKFRVSNPTDDGTPPNPNVPQFLIQPAGTSDQRQFLVTGVKSPDECIVAEPKARSLSPKRCSEECHRSASPYPNLVLSVPRNSTCSELDNSRISVQEVDEDALSRSPTPERIVALESQHSSTEFWNNKVLVVPARSGSRSGSRTPKKYCSGQETPILEALDRRKSRSESDFLNMNGILGNDLLDSLDGVKNRRNRRSIKKKGRKDQMLGASSSKPSDTAKTLTSAANVLKTVNNEVEAGSSKEPFWVN